MCSMDTYMSVSSLIFVYFMIDMAHNSEIGLNFLISFTTKLKLRWLLYVMQKKCCAQITNNTEKSFGIE